VIDPFMIPAVNWSRCLVIRYGCLSRNLRRARRRARRL